MGVALIHADRETEGRTDMTKLIDTVRDCVEVFFK